MYAHKEELSLHTLMYQVQWMLYRLDKCSLTLFK
jgi:hypothetical protein